MPTIVQEFCPVRMTLDWLGDRAMRDEKRAQHRAATDELRRLADERRRLGGWPSSQDHPEPDGPSV